MRDTQPPGPHQSSNKGVVLLLLGGMLILAAAATVWWVRNSEPEKAPEPPPEVTVPAAEQAPLVLSQPSRPIIEMKRDAGLVEEVSDDPGQPRKQSTSAVPEKMGEIDARLVNSFINSRFEQVRSCYEMRLKKNPMLEGALDLNIGISTKGRATTIGVNRDTVNDKEMLDCVKKRIRGWDFPKPEGGKVVIAKSFKFKKKT